MPAPTMAMRGAGERPGGREPQGRGERQRSERGSAFEKVAPRKLGGAATAQFSRGDAETLGGVMLAREAPQRAQQRGPGHGFLPSFGVPERSMAPEGGGRLKEEAVMWRSCGLALLREAQLQWQLLCCGRSVTPGEQLVDPSDLAQTQVHEGPSPAKPLSFSSSSCRRRR